VKGGLFKVKLSNVRQDKGVAGLTILLSLVTMLFVIGLLIMIYSLMGGELINATDDATAQEVINDTSQAIASTTDWFSIFIVIGAMVVLILLTVIIITAIRGSGLMAGSA
jgi:flagellar biosynthesis protein FlhB